MQPIYLDANATTPLLPAVAEAMLPLLTSVGGNPASAHASGRHARQDLEAARERTAALLGAHPDELVFTSGATEANNLALFGLSGAPPAHLLASPIEHPSVAEPLRQLAIGGFSLEELPVGPTGIVPASAVAEQIRPDTRLVCVMLVNHETGAVQPIAELARNAPAFHCDATQAVGKRAVDFHALGVTTLAFSAHKFHGPVGVGGLLVRRGTKLAPRTWGGHQQQGRRPGTEPVALAVGLAAALDIALRDREQRWAHVARLRQRLLERLGSEAAPVVVNGPGGAEGSPYVLNVSFPGCRSDALLMNLDLAGVACATGSACSSGSLLPSPVLRAMGVAEDVLASALRFSFSILTTEAEIEEAASRVVEVVRRLRRFEAEEKK